MSLRLPVYHLHDLHPAKPCKLVSYSSFPPHFPTKPKPTNIVEKLNQKEIKT